MKHPITLIRMSITAALITAVAATFILVPATTKAEEGLTCTQLINLLIAIEVIPAEKADMARAICDTTVVSTPDPVPVVPTVTILSPNGGETVTSSTLNTKWTTNNVTSATVFTTARLRSASSQEYYLSSYVLNDGQETFSIPSTVPDGAYTFELKTYVGTTLVMDASNASFTLRRSFPDPISNTPFASLLVNGSAGTVTVAKGEAVTISWKASNVQACAVYGGGDTNSTYDFYATGLMGSKSHTPTRTTSYEIHCFNNGYSAVSQKVAVVLGAIESDPVENDFPVGALTVSITGGTQSASNGGTLYVPESTNPYAGTALTVYWNAQNVEACAVKNISGQFFGGNGLEGSKSFAPKQDTTLQLNCYADADSGVVVLSSTVSIVIVTEPVVVPEVQPKTPTVTILSPNGEETVTSSALSTKWTTNNVTSATVFTTARLRSASSQEYYLSSYVLNDEQETFSIPSTVPDGAYTFELKTYVGTTLVMDGSDASFTLKRSSEPTVPSGELYVNGKSDSVSVVRGSTVIIEWKSFNVDQCAVYGKRDGSTSYDFYRTGKSGTDSHIPSASTTYSLECFRNGYSAASQSVKVDVLSTPVPITGSLTVTIAGTNTSASDGGTITVPPSSNPYSGTPLTVVWRTQNTTNCAVRAYGSIIIGGSGLSGSTTYAPKQNVPLTLQCVDSNQATVLSKIVNIVISETPSTPAPSITTTSLPAGTVGVSYANTGVTVTGGSGDVKSWAITSGTLPPGISLNQTACPAIYPSSCSELATIPFYGTPTTAGTYRFTITATVGTQTASKQLSIVVNPAATISMKGDLTGDGKVTALDALRLFSSLTGGPALTTAERSVADVNNDNAINQWDADGILAYAVSGSFTNYSAVTRKAGDLNGDGQIAASDALYVSYFLEKGTPSLTPQQTAAADVDQDGRITRFDANAILKASVGIITIPFKFGDVNNDGKITSTDALYVASYLSGTRTLSAGEFFRADINQDQIVNTVDRDAIMNAAVGLGTLPIVSVVESTKTAPQTASFIEGVKNATNTVVYVLGHWYKGYTMPMSRDGQTSVSDSFSASVGGLLDDYFFLVGNWYRGYSVSIR